MAVDGRGGAGKSTLAERLARELDATVVHTDDFASWENPLDWWPALLEQVLEPLARGEAATFVPNDWGGPAKERVTVEPGSVVVLEGVTASREAFRPYLSFSVWVETPRELCLQRGLARDGEEMRAQWEAWMAAEDRYIAAERPQEHADLVVRGDEPLDDRALRALRPEPRLWRLRVGILLFVLSWFPFAQILIHVARANDRLTSDASANTFRLVVWGIQFVVGLVGIWLVGSLALAEAKRAGWRRTPGHLWRLFVHGSEGTAT